MHASSTPDNILRARLPRWLLPTAWPQQGHQPALADLHLAGSSRWINVRFLRTST